jgi:DNA-binding MarR family transcriptional regulator
MATQNPRTETRHPPASPAALDRTLSYRLHLLHKLTDMDSQHAYLREAGLSLSDGRCLATIGTFEPLSVKDLAQRANLDKGQASRAAQALVDQGLVCKQHDKADARGVVLTLTDAGRTAFERTMALVRRRNQQIFGCLSEAEQQTLSTLFDRLIDHSRQA